MAIVERPNLRDKMIAAQNREQAAKAARLSARIEGRVLNVDEEKRIRAAFWERLAAEKTYYSQSCRGIPPWEQSLARWALAIFIVVISTSAIWQLM